MKPSVYITPSTHNRHAETNGNQIMRLDTVQQPLKATVVDPTHLKLSRPIPVGTGQVVYVAFFHPEAEQNENSQWQAASRQTLEKAYGDDEPDYCAAMVKESNEDYQA